MRCQRQILFVVCAISILFVSAEKNLASAEVSASPFSVQGFRITPSLLQAGAHENLEVAFDFGHDPATGKTYNDVREVRLNLPEGFDASNTAVPTCPLSDLLGFAGANGQLPTCPIASQVGLISFEFTNPKGASLHPAEVTVPLYNMEVTSYGVAAESGFKTQVFSQTIQVHALPGNAQISVVSTNIPKYEIHNVSSVVWGVPAAAEHDEQRGETCGAEFEIPAHCRNEFGGPQGARVAIKPFLSNPTSCEREVTGELEALSWENPEEALHATASVGPIVGCDRVPFDPSLEIDPSVSSAESATGLNASLVVPQSWESAYSIASSHLDNTRVALPLGMTINPSSASGLQACTRAQYESETALSSPGVRVSSGFKAWYDQHRNPCSCRKG